MRTLLPGHLALLFLLQLKSRVLHVKVMRRPRKTEGKRCRRGDWGAAQTHSVCLVPQTESWR